MPVSATIGEDGFATITFVEPLPYTSAAPESGAPTRQRHPRGDETSNPDASATAAAIALDGLLTSAERADYVGMRIVRDPHARFAFQFRQDASAALARHSRDQRFVAVSGGVPAAELRRVFDEWRERFQPDRLVGGGTAAEFDGVVRLDMTIEEAGFRNIASERRWTLPERLELRFAPPRVARPVDPGLARLVRISPRQDSRPAVVNDSAPGGRIVLRDGCFRLSGADRKTEPLVVFGRDVGLAVDASGHMVVGGAGTPDRRVRIGEQMTWGGPRTADERDAGVRAVKAKCGTGPIVSVGEPISERRFKVRQWAIDDLAGRRGISRQAAWEETRACLLRAERARSNAPSEDCDDPAVLR